MKVEKSEEIIWYMAEPEGRRKELKVKFSISNTVVRKEGAGD